MRVVFGALLALSALGLPASAGETDPAVSATFQGWSLPIPGSGGLIFCHGYNCNFRTQIGLSGADQARLARLVEAGRASGEAERRAIARTEAWFEKRVAPQAGT